MDPITGFTAAGHSMSGRLTFYVALQLTSVLLPGIVALTELTLLGVHFVPHSGHDITFLLSSLAKVQGTGAVMFAALGLGGSFVIGYLGRALGFSVVGRAERVAAWWAHRRRKSAPADLTRMRHVISEEATDECVRLHPVLQYLEENQPQPDKPLALPAGGSHRADGRLHAFEYSKLWLRRFAPVLNVDSLEVEINILVATLFPLALASANVAVFPRISTAVRWTVIGICAASALAVLVQAVRLRTGERWYAVRNLAFDLCMRQAAIRYPDAVTESDGQPDSVPGQGERRDRSAHAERTAKA